jgi:hypothetical protein
MSKKVSTYWDVIKDNETHYSSGGWEVSLRKNCYYDHKKDREVFKLEFVWPYWEGVSRKERSECRKDVLVKRKLEKILASSSRDREEYRDLNQRIDTPELIQKIFDLYKGGLKGFELGKYIREGHYTMAEANSLFYRM